MDFNNTQAIYLQIADYVCDQIQLQQWQTDDKIPSVREMAVNLEVNPNTVMRSYDHLRAAGNHSHSPGHGLFCERKCNP